MTDDVERVSIDRETLETLREFADAHLSEYGWSVKYHHAVIDSGVALGLDDPTPATEFKRIDPEALREIDGDDAVDELREKWKRHGRDGGAP